MDLVRAALGEEQISYLGFSYGTALGATYASFYPERVRAMVLDGAIDPRFDLLAFAREQAVAVEAALTAYDAAAQRAGWHGVAVLEAVSARAESAPVRSAGGLRLARASDILYGSVEAVSDPDAGWHELALALGAAQAGDGAGFVKLSDRYFARAPDGTEGLRVEAQLAVLCADLHRLASAEAYRDATPELGRIAPHIGVANLVSHLPCAFWLPPARPLEPLRAVEAAGILVIAGRSDPLTPHIWGERLVQQLPMSTLLSVDTRQHTAYGRGRACVDAAVESVLLSGSAPVPAPECP
jgi:pimeloyl-ACP methyl ester carboxylesterase